MNNKLTLLLGLCLVTTVGLALPSLQPAQAGLTDILTSWITKVITGVIDVFTFPFAIVLMIIQAVTGILPVISAEIYKVTIALNDTIALTPASANAGPNDMVVVGWRFTRDLANMFFVVILAWVGFATILRLKSYEIKTIIPKLVIIALLINFIPVITGIILDVAGIFTKYFADKSLNIGALLWEKLPATEIARGGTDGLLQLIPGQGGISGIAVKSLMGIVFNIIAFLMLGLYAVIFIVRIVMIWVLVVLAPIAWLGYIIPNGQKMWSMWWKQFLQWAIVGIGLTFSLYLSGFVLGGSMDCSVDEVAINQQYGFATGILSGILGENLICNTLPFIAGITIMLVGFILSITIAPSGANSILKGAQKGGLAAGRVAGNAFYRGPLKQYAKGAGEALRTSGRAALFPLKVTGKTAGSLIKDVALRRVPGRPGSLERLTYPFKVGASVTKAQAAKDFGDLPVKLKSWATLGMADPAKRKAAKDGTVKALKDSAKAGWAAAIGKKQKKKPTSTKRCPDCSNWINDSEDVCPKCGHIF